MNQVQDVLQNLLATVARFVEEEPLLASLASVVLVALCLWLMSKIAKAAAVFAFVVAVLAGLLVYTLGPDRARSYLDQIREGPAAAERH